MPNNVASICDAVDRWRDDDTLDAPMLEAEHAYFRARYFDGGAVTHHFQHLHLPANALDAVNGAFVGIAMCQIAVSEEPLGRSHPWRGLPRSVWIL